MTPSGMPLTRTDARDAPAKSDGSPVADTPGPVLFLQYTSGSTSDPRGVIVGHANIIANHSVFKGGEVGVTWLPWTSWPR